MTPAPVSQRSREPQPSAINELAAQKGGRDTRIKSKEWCGELFER
jgi:hypothetical protein